MNQPAGREDGIHVAIIGGGIAGVTLALGLQRRGVSFTLYERAREIREIGAGIGLSPNAERAMILLDPETVHGAFKRVVVPNGVDEFQWIDGFRTDELIYSLYMGKDGFQGCRRSDMVEELLKSIPPDRMRLGKQAASIREVESSDSGQGSRSTAVEITFEDTSTAIADVVVGCDGIWSRVREILLGSDDPASHAGYTGKYCFRALVPLEEAYKTLGHERAHTRYMYNGPGAHAITYPVGLGDTAVLNVLVVLSDTNPDGWPLKETGGKHTAAGRREEAEHATRDFHPTFRKVVSLLPEKLEKWAIFDSLEHPASTFAKDKICLAGDAAHATGPHLGAGAGVGIEDALLLSTLLEAVDKHARVSAGSNANALEGTNETIRRALEVYDQLRRDRTQWLVRATREAVDLFQWKYGEAAGRDGEAFGHEISKRFHTIWDYDLEAMMKEGLQKLAVS